MGNDKELQKLIKCVEEKSIDHKDADLRKYSNVFNELAVVDGLVLRGERIVVPQTLREAIGKIAHEGHQGIVRTKQLLRAHVWFPCMDTMVEKHDREMPRLPIYHALSHQRAATDDRFAKGSVEKGQCKFRGAVTKQRHGVGLLGPVCQVSSR